MIRLMAVEDMAEILFTTLVEREDMVVIKFMTLVVVVADMVVM